MSATPYIKIQIEGDFIDSFLYSGTLFLVHSSAKITTHSWEALLDHAIYDNWGNHTNPLTVAFLKDCRRKFSPPNTTDTIHIPEHRLLEYQRSSLQLDRWPTDINVYSNNLYIANENGVDELKYNHETRQIEAAGRFSIYKKYAYKISPNNGHRIAIAAGINGVIAAYPRTGFIKPNDDLSPLIEVDAHDCEWIGGNLAANSVSGAFLLKFPELPKKPDGRGTPEYWESYNKIRREAPISKKLESEVEGKLPYAWVAGGKLFKLYETGDLHIEPISEDAADTQLQHIEFPPESTEGREFLGASDNRILAARTSLFGTVAEIGDSLFSINEDGIEMVSSRPVSWRVFPRAKNYLNQLHIVENDSVVIRAYSPQQDKNSFSRFGITFDEVI